MTQPQFLSAMAALASGLVAAWYWYKSTTAKIDPGIRKMDDGRDAFRVMAWVESVMNTAATASDFNRKAALWTAASVLLAAISAILGAWPSN